MASNWSVTGSVGSVKKDGSLWFTDIADNIYVKNQNGEQVKESVVWFNCVSDFKPNVKKGDRVIANGIFKDSKNPRFQYAMFIKNIGVITKDLNSPECLEEV